MNRQAHPDRSPLDAHLTELDRLQHTKTFGIVADFGDLAIAPPQLLLIFRFKVSLWNSSHQWFQPPELIRLRLYGVSRVRTSENSPTGRWVSPFPDSSYSKTAVFVCNSDVGLISLVIEISKEHLKHMVNFPCNLLAASDIKDDWCRVDANSKFPAFSLTTTIKDSNP